MRNPRIRHRNSSKRERDSQAEIDKRANRAHGNAGAVALTARKTVHPGDEIHALESPVAHRLRYCAERISALAKRGFLFDAMIGETMPFRYVDPSPRSDSLHSEV